MYTRHTEVQQLRSEITEVQAIYYNHVKIALKRLDKQIRFKIPTLKHLDLILQDDAWIVVDTVLNDMPIIAWSDFKVESRETLHQSVVCKIRFYHFAADKIMNKTLEAMELVLGEKLSDDLPDSISHILNFKKK
ncbi:hypothetical protein MNBD_GAMMA07-2306 [hydrothermal vent metagenome]|uniref:Uncharacterized protein n=1 Tax=hydrothermal vent metagenome TaxID=652676 RepID=A0A3B0XLG9_9ZZZZ